MNLLQKNTIDTFIKTIGKKTLTEYSKIINIERTRLFRLFNGAEMKLSEFEKFQQCLLSHNSELLNWDLVISKNYFQEKSSQNIGFDLSLQVERSQRLNSLLNKIKPNDRRIA